MSVERVASYSSPSSFARAPESSSCKRRSFAPSLSARCLCHLTALLRVTFCRHHPPTPRTSIAKHTPRVFPAYVTGTRALGYMHVYILFMKGVNCNWRAGPGRSATNEHTPKKNRTRAAVSNAPPPAPALGLGSGRSMAGLCLAIHGDFVVWLLIIRNTLNNADRRRIQLCIEQRRVVTAQAHVHHNSVYFKRFARPMHAHYSCAARWVYNRDGARLT